MSIFGNIKTGNNKTADEWFKQSEILSDENKFAEALSCIVEAIKLEPNDYKKWNRKGFILYHENRITDALFCFDKSIEMEPNNSSAWSNKTAMLIYTNRYEEALVCIDESLKLEPNDAIALNNKAGALCKLSRYLEATDCIDQAIKLQPDNAGFLNGKATTLAHTYKFEEAIKMSNTAIALEPQTQHFQDNNSTILEMLRFAKEHCRQENISYERFCEVGYTEYGKISHNDVANNFALLSWQNAEDLVGKLFEKKDYHSTVTQRTGDFGIDVEAKSATEYLGIQVKHWNADVGFEDVAKTLGVSSKFNKVIIISTKTGFTHQAKEFAGRDENRFRLELWNGQRFKQELRQFVIER